MSLTVTRVSKRRNDLAEGPHWDVNTQRLYHVDAFVGDICRLDPTTGETEAVHLDGIATFVIPYLSDPSSLLVTCSAQVRKLNFNTGQSKLLTQVYHENPEYRFNDGKCDSRGRLWTGTMIFSEQEKGYLYKMGKNYSLQQVEDKISISNGLAWSLDNNTMYFIDSEPRLIYAFDYDLESGMAKNKRVLIDYNTDADYKDCGLPDGMTIDIEGKLWVANYGAGCVVRIDPETKALLRTVKIPSKYTTSCCFGGLDFDILYVTTGSKGDESFPEAGAVFAVIGHGTRGQPPNQFVS